MLREFFAGKRPSHFHINPVVQTLLITDVFLWSAWNLFTPVLAIFAADNIRGGSVQIAGSAISIYLIVRVLFELISGHFLNRSSESKKLTFSITGMLILSLSYFGLAYTGTVSFLFIWIGLAGVGLGLSTPARYSIFSQHLDKNKDAEEWGFRDAVIFIGMALSGALGGFIAGKYGFSILFIIAAIVNLIGVIPQALLVKAEK